MADRYQKFFEDADVDQSGFLSQDELIGMLRRNGYKGDDDQIKVCLLALETILCCFIVECGVVMSLCVSVLLCLLYLVTLVYCSLFR